MMNIAHPGIIRFSGYQMTDFCYRSDSNYVLPDEGLIEYSFSFQKRIEYPAEQNMLVFLRTNVFVGENEKESPRSMSLELVGKFESDTAIRPQWEVNALAILFPYARSILSSVTSQSGMPPVILPTVNIAQMFKNANESTQ